MVARSPFATDMSTRATNFSIYKVFDATIGNYAAAVSTAIVGVD